MAKSGVPNIQKFVIRRGCYSPAHFSDLAVQRRTNVDLGIGKVLQRTLQTLAAIESFTSAENLRHNPFVLAIATGGDICTGCDFEPALRTALLGSHIILALTYR